MSQDNGGKARCRFRTLLVASVPDRVQQFIRGRNAIGPIDDRAVLADDEDGAIDLLAVDTRLPWDRLQHAVLPC